LALNFSSARTVGTTPAQALEAGDALDVSLRVLASNSGRVS